jgi:vacuolar-type H+-ATPase subunit H
MSVAGNTCHFFKVVDMATDGLRRIKEAEERAEDLIDDALDNADRIASDAQIDAARLVSDAEARARQEASRLSAHIQDEAEAEIQAMNLETEKQRDIIRKQGKQQMEEAVTAIVDGLQPLAAGR